MRASSIITTLLLLLATSCSNDTTRYDAGVSRELAEWRKETISELKYNIDIDLVENIGKVDIELEGKVAIISCELELLKAERGIYFKVTDGFDGKDIFDSYTQGKCFQGA